MYNYIAEAAVAEGVPAQLCIMDASTGIVHFYSIPREVADSDIDEVETYIEEVLKFKITNCHWMIINELINHCE